MIQAHPSGLLCLVKTLHAESLGKKDGKMLDRRSTRSFVELRLARYFSIPTVPVLSVWRRVSLNRFMGQHLPRPEIRTLNRPSGGPGPDGSCVLHGHEPRKGSLPCVDLLLRVEERHSKQERRSKSNTFITTWLERSERDKSPPVVRRSAVEWPPPNTAWVTWVRLRGNTEVRLAR